jgi:hypothetical protein
MPVLFLPPHSDVPALIWQAAQSGAPTRPGTSAKSMPAVPSTIKPNGKPASVAPKITCEGPIGKQSLGNCGAHNGN